jgi:hypothetical protein
LHKQVDRYAYGPPPIRFSEDDVDQARAAAVWLGHESTDSSEAYLHSNNTIKQDAIEKIAPIDTPPGRYKPSDKLLAFLESL